MPQQHYRNWTEVHLSHIEQNLRVLRAHLPGGCKIMGVVKANAYGHGDGPVSKALLRAGAEWLAVSNIDEALSLRRQGVERNVPVLILVETPPDALGDLLEERLTPTVFSAEYGVRLAAAARRADIRLPVHVKIDTGMTRLGYAPDQLDEIVALCAHPHIDALGVYTHFASADEPAADDYTRGQFELFMRVLAALKERGVTFALRHCCNSAGALRFPQYSLDIVRPGIALYGDVPGPDCAGILDLKPAMEWYGAISMVKSVKKGVPISYGRVFTAPRDMLVATVPIGYADGYGREQSAVGGWALLRGRRAPVVGRVCMDQLMLDVTDIPGARPGDVAAFAGAPGAPSFTDMATRAGTLVYEKLCAVGGSGSIARHIFPRYIDSAGD